jgi:hypothetical protein
MEGESSRTVVGVAYNTGVQVPFEVSPMRRAAAVKVCVTAVAGGGTAVHGEKFLESDKLKLLEDSWLSGFAIPYATKCSRNGLLPRRAG